MNTTEKVLIGGSATLLAITAMVLISKKASASTTNASTSGSGSKSSGSSSKTNNAPPPPPPPVLGDAASLANNYVVMTFYIASKLKDNGNVTEATTLIQQLKDAWENSPNGVPMYNNASALATKGMPPTGKFAYPSLFGTVYGSQNDKLMAVYGNALQVLAVIIKNMIQSKEAGMAVGVRQGIVISDYTTAVKDITKIDEVPIDAATLMADYFYQLNETWPKGHGGGSNSYSDLNTIIKDALSVAGLALKFV